MNKIFAFGILLVFSTSALATDWSKRLKPTTDLVTKDEEVWTAFDINCQEPFTTIKTKNYREKNTKTPKHMPQIECLQGVFDKSVYHKRDQSDPISYKTIDGKPYLEFFFSVPSRFAQKNVSKKGYTLKLIVHDINGKGKYPIYHQNETFKPMMDKDKPIIKYKNMIPMINYSKGRYIPVIIGSFAAFRDAELVKMSSEDIKKTKDLGREYEEKGFASTYSSGERLYGAYAPNDMKKIMPSNKKLGEIEIINIDQQGKIAGTFRVRVLRETCNDLLLVSDCRTTTTFVKGEFVAAEFKSNKAYIKKQLLNPTVKLRPKMKLPMKGLPKRRKPSKNETIMDRPQPRLHRPQMGAQCRGPVNSACKAAETTFQRYSACLKKYNFKKNDAQDTARKNLRMCHRYYETYKSESVRCRTLFVEDDNCE